MTRSFRVAFGRGVACSTLAVSALGAALTAQAQTPLLFAEDFESANPAPAWPAWPDWYVPVLPGWQQSGYWHPTAPDHCGVGSSNSLSYTSKGYEEDACDFRAWNEYGGPGRSFGSAISPTISGVDAGSALSFDYWRQVEGFSYGYDETLVNVIDIDTSSVTNVFYLSSSTPSEATWKSSGQISLAQFAGKSIRIEFVFDSVDDLFNGDDGYYDPWGWFVDDIEVTCTDADADGVCDSLDNCIDVAGRISGPDPADQFDADGDGYGNLCDPDFGQDGHVLADDYGTILNHFGQSAPHIDVTGDGEVLADDLGVLLQYFGEAPGPSGLACADPTLVTPGSYAESLGNAVTGQPCVAP